MTRLAHRIVSSRTFQRFIVGVILFAGVLSGLETSVELAARFGHALRLLDAGILAIFILEIGLKIAAHGRRPLQFFRDGWNIFDCAIVVLCLTPGGGSLGIVLRLARVLRLLRLVTALPKLQLLVGALLRSLSAMGYVGILLAMLFYMYAVAGVHLFSRSDEDFGTLGAALLTLFRVVTLDDWGNIYARAAEHAPAFKVAVYFVTFILFGTMIVMNLFIGIILNSLSETHAEIERSASDKNAREIDDPFAALERKLDELREDIRNIRARRLGESGKAPPPST